MAFVRLNLASLAQHREGVVAMMFDKAISRIVADCQQASDIPDKREVTLKVIAKPVTERGELVSIAFDFRVGAKTPEVGTGLVAEYARKAGQTAGAYFNIDSPDDPRQLTFLNDDDLEKLIEESDSHAAPEDEGDDS